MSCSQNYHFYNRLNKEYHTQQNEVRSEYYKLISLRQPETDISHKDHRQHILHDQSTERVNAKYQRKAILEQILRHCRTRQRYHKHVNCAERYVHDVSNPNIARISRHDNHRTFNQRTYGENPCVESLEQLTWNETGNLSEQCENRYKI